MRLRHGVEKQELMHHFLGSAGRSAHPPLETWRPATKEQGLAGSGAPRPLSRRLHHSGGAPHAHPAGGHLSRRQPRPRGRRPKSPNQWRGHGVESLGGRRPQQAGTHTRPRPAEASSKSAPAPPGGQPTYAPLLGSAAIAKPVNQKQGLPAGSPCFYLHSQSCGCAGFLLLFLILRLCRIPSLRDPFILPGYR